MSSSAGQESRVDSQVNRALEAAKDPFLRKIAERFQKEPNQISRLSEILGFTLEEEKNTKALIWLKKHEPDRYLFVSSVSEAKDKKPEARKMKMVLGDEHYRKDALRRLERLKEKISAIAAKSGLEFTEVETFSGISWWGFAFKKEKFISKDILLMICVKCEGETIDYLLMTAPQRLVSTLKEQKGWLDISIPISERRKEYINVAKRIAQTYMRRSKRKAEVVKEY